MYSTAQYCERENLHLHLVLVAVPGIPLESGDCLQNRDSLQPVHQSVRAPTQIQTSQKRVYRHYHRQKLCRRLVSLLSTWTEYRLRYFQGRHTRISKETWIQIPRHWRDLTH